MKSHLEPARVMVACDSAQRGEEVMLHLKGAFEQVCQTAEPNPIAADFEAFAPDVLVFAFESLARTRCAQRDLYRIGRSVLGRPYRTIVLCDEADLAAAFELCMQGHFDDYAPWGPTARDVLRLTMCIFSSHRELRMLRPSMPTVRDLLAHVNHLKELDDALSGPTAAPGSPLSPAAPSAGRPLDAPIESALAATRLLTQAVRKIRPLVMVVDDDVLARQLIGRALGPDDYDVRFARDGVEAVSQLRRVRPDVILMDVCMPEIDGLSLTQLLKADPDLAGIPIILMTSDSKRETLASSINAGAAAFLPKPYTRESLTTKLRKVLGLGSASL